MAAILAGVKKGQEKRAAKTPEAVFKKYDDDNSGGIDVQELTKACKELRVSATSQQLQAVVDTFGHDSALKYPAFEQLVLVLREEQELAKQAKLDDLPKTYGPLVLPMQRPVIKCYNHPIVVYSVAACILGNFLVNIIEKEVDPLNKYPETWKVFDDAFNIIFTVELVTNMYQYAGPRKRFWRSPWNVFDTVIVLVSDILMIGGDALPGELKKLKLMRALRVFRLFKRIKSLNKIIVALVQSIPGVLNAMVIMIIAFCIYAILAVELFSPFGADGQYPVYHLEDCETAAGTACPLPSGALPTGASSYVNLSVTSVTARGLPNGFEYYGTFSRALYTLFQVMTGESWSEAIARPLIFGLYDNAITASVFFVSFLVVTQIVLVNVVVAVLLDNFTASGSDDEEEVVNADAIIQKMHLLINGEDGAGSPASSPAGAASLTLDKSFPLPPPPHAALSASATADQKLDRVLVLLQSLEQRMTALETMQASPPTSPPPLTAPTSAESDPKRSALHLNVGNLFSANRSLEA